MDSPAGGELNALSDLMEETPPDPAWARWPGSASPADVSAPVGCDRGPPPLRGGLPPAHNSNPEKNFRQTQNRDILQDTRPVPLKTGQVLRSKGNSCHSPDRPRDSTPRGHAALGQVLGQTGDAPGNRRTRGCGSAADPVQARVWHMLCGDVGKGAAGQGVRAVPEGLGGHPGEGAQLGLGWCFSPDTLEL